MLCFISNTANNAMYYNYDDSTVFFTVTPNLQLTLMTGLQFEQYFDKIEKVDKEGFNETLVVEVRTQDKKAILAAAEADKAREPPQVYREEVVEEPPSSGKGREGKGKDYLLLNQRLEVFLVSNVILFWGE